MIKNEKKKKRKLMIEKVLVLLFKQRLCNAKWVVLKKRGRKGVREGGEKMGGLLSKRGWLPKKNKGNDVLCLFKKKQSP